MLKQIYVGGYIDSNRNIAVNLDSTELRKSLKKFTSDDGAVDNSGLVNSQMYQREAAHFSAKKMFGAASHKLALGESRSPAPVRVR